MEETKGTDTRHSAKSGQSKAQTKAVVEPKLVWKGQQMYRHDLFKLELASALRNHSHKAGILKLEDVEHVHHFHSHDSKGRPNKYCQPVAGHTHEMFVSMDEEGNITAKTGPALEKFVKRSKTGKIKSGFKPIEWYDDDKERMIPDGHTHEVTYKRSEKLSIEKKQNGDAMAVASLLKNQTKVSPEFQNEIKEG